MRDKDRIGPILARLGDIWKEHPDLRLGQFIMNLQSKVSLYYIEDIPLLNALETFYCKEEKNDSI